MKNKGREIIGGVDNIVKAAVDHLKKNGKHGISMRFTSSMLKVEKNCLSHLNIKNRKKKKKRLKKKFNPPGNLHFLVYKLIKIGPTTSVAHRSTFSLVLLFFQKRK